MRKILLATVAALSLFTAAPVMAEIPPTLKKVGNWEIFIDPTTNGCSMIVSYKNGTLLRFGVGNNKKPYLLVANPAWQSIVVDHIYSLTVRNGDTTAWELKATGLRLGDGALFGIVARDLAPEFMKSIYSHGGLSFYVGDTPITNLTLTDYGDAMSEVFNCQVVIDKKQSDPFAGTPATPHDPFAGAPRSHPATSYHQM